MSFLEQQLPQMKKDLDAAETKYNALRNKRGTIDLSEEAKLILAQSVDAQTKVMELRAKRQDLITRFAPTHPSILAIDRQIASLTGDVNRIGNNIKQLPDLEQDVVRLVRDVRVNTELYTALLNNTQQLKLIRAGKVGNVRILDAAVQPDKPVRPKAAIIILVASAIGLIIGLLSALVRNALFGGLSEPEEVERYTGLPVLAAIPTATSRTSSGAAAAARMRPCPRCWRRARATRRPSKACGASAMLQASLRQSANNMVMFTGPVAGVGKSFLSANFAFIQGGVGKRVLLIDADFRKGQLNRYFGVPGRTACSRCCPARSRWSRCAGTACPRAWISFPPAPSPSTRPSCWPRPCSARRCASCPPSTTWWCWIPRRCCPRRMQQWWAAMRPR